MSFYLYLAAGFAAGLLGGMGMGGGTLLIPILTLLGGVEQHAAQAANLFAFLPMAAVSLAVHRKSGFVSRGGEGFLVVPAIVFSVFSGIAANFLPGGVLKKLFGVFLTFLGLKGLFTLGSARGK